MKKIIFLLFAVIPLIAFSQKAKIEFETTTHNFGTISEFGGQASFDFIFKNTGNAPLILTNVRAGCGCTTPEWSRQPIPPGQTGKVNVKYDPRNRPGQFTKSVTVNSNGDPSVVSLVIRGNVTKQPVDPYAAYTYTIGNLKIASNNINFGNITNTKIAEKQMEFVNIGEQPITVTVEPTPKYMVVTLVPATLTKGQKGVLTVKFDANAKKDWGFVTDKIALSTDQNTQGNITIAANINEDLSKFAANSETAPVAVFSELEKDLGTLTADSKYTHEFYIQNTGKSDLIIRKIKTSDNSITATPAKMTIKPDKKIKVTVHLKTDSEAGKKTKVISFTLNDPKTTNITYKINGNVQ